MTRYGVQVRPTARRLRVANPNPTSAEIDQNQEPALKAVLWFHLREEGSK